MVCSTKRRSHVLRRTSVDLILTNTEHPHVGTDETKKKKKSKMQKSQSDRAIEHMTTTTKRMKEKAKQNLNWTFDFTILIYSIFFCSFLLLHATIKSNFIHILHHL